MQTYVRLPLFFPFSLSGRCCAVAVVGGRRSTWAAVPVVEFPWLQNITSIDLRQSIDVKNNDENNYVSVNRLFTADCVFPLYCAIGVSR